MQLFFTTYTFLNLQRYTTVYDALRYPVGEWRRVSLFDDQWPPQNMTIVIESMLLYDQVHDNSMLANGSDTNW